jgi:hypothetical protein
MSEERATAGSSELARWLIIAVLVVLGLVLYFVYAPGSAPVATPTVQENP